MLRPTSGSAASTASVQRATSALRSRSGVFSCAAEESTRRATHRSGAARSKIAATTPRNPPSALQVARAARRSPASATRRWKRARIAGQLAQHGKPEQRAQHAGRAREGLLGEDFAPLGADAGDIVVDLQERGPGGAQIRVELVELGLLGLQLIGGGVGLRRPRHGSWASTPRAACARRRAAASDRR